MKLWQGSLCHLEKMTNPELNSKPPLPNSAKAGHESCSISGPRPIRPTQPVDRRTDSVSIGAVIH